MELSLEIKKARHSVIVSIVVTAVVQLTRAGLTDFIKVTGLPALLRLGDALPCLELPVMGEASCLQLSSIIEVRKSLGARSLELTDMFMLAVSGLLSRPSTSPTSIIRLLSVLKSGVRLAREWERVRRDALDTHNLPVCLLNVTDVKVLVRVLVVLCIALNLALLLRVCMALDVDDKDRLPYRLPIVSDRWPTLLVAGTVEMASLRRVM